MGEVGLFRDQRVELIDGEILDMAPQDSPVAPISRRWAMDEYYRLGELGFFIDQRVELIDGEIIDMAPQKDLHAAGVSLSFRVIWKILGDAFWVRCQLPLRLGSLNEPEPDVSVVSGSEREYVGKGHPSTALLVIEVSDTSLDFDRTIKSSLYASANIGDYWILNLIDRQLEVFRNPITDASARFGWTYAQRTILKSTEQIKPLAAQTSACIADMLP